jgi:hypothetical protein
MKDTETLDKLYLEWSNFTNARNAREIEALAFLEWLDRKGGMGRDVHERIKKLITMLSV